MIKHVNLDSLALLALLYIFISTDDPGSISLQHMSSRGTAVYECVQRDPRWSVQTNGPLDSSLMLEVRYCSQDSQLGSGFSSTRYS